jgi:membrane-associated phospholipid phosphatase
LPPARLVPRARWWAELLTIAWLCWLYDAIANLAPVRLHVALAHGAGVLSAEQALHIDPERALDTWLAAHRTVGLIVSDYYDNAHFVITLGLLGLLWWRRADIYRPLRNALVAVNLVGFVVFWLFPVAPPRMLPGFVDVVAVTGAIGSWHTGSLASHANELAAMPSLHMAWAGWCAVAVWRITRRPLFRGLAIGHVVLTAAAVLATGNHYVLDLVGGLLALVAAFLLAGSAERALARRRTPRLATLPH